MITSGNKRNINHAKIEDYYKLDTLLGFGSYSKVKLASEISSGRSILPPAGALPSLLASPWSQV